MPGCRRLLPLIPLLVLASCAPRTEGVALNTDLTPVGLLTSRIRETDARLRTLSGHGSVSFETPSQDGSAGFDLTMKKPDSLLVQLEGPFGIDVGTFFLSRKRYVMYNSLENAVSTGSPESGSLRSVLPIDLTYDQMFSVFTGTFPLPDSVPPLSYSIAGDQFLLRYPRGDGNCSYWIDPDALLVRRFEIRDAGGSIMLESETSGMIVQDGTRIPRRVSITMPHEERRVAIAYSSASINPDRVSFAFTVPPNARSMAAPR